MHPVLVQIGPVTIRYYGLMYVLAIIIGIWLTYREIKRKELKLTLDDLLDFVLLAIPLGIIFARLYYVAFKWWDYYYSPEGLWPTLQRVIAIWEGGLVFHGGLIGGFVALWIFCRWKRVGFWTFADAVAPSVVLGQALGRFGNFMNGDAYGTPTALPWGIKFPLRTPAGDAFPDTALHPAMLYEMIGNLIIFGILLWLRTKPYREGFIVSLYTLLYSVLRFVVESWRGDSLWLTEQIRAAQAISLLLILIFGALMLARQLYVRQPTASSPQPPAPS